VTLRVDTSGFVGVNAGVNRAGNRGDFNTMSSTTLQSLFTDGDSGRMSREEILLHVVTHGGCHRGHVGQVLKPISVAPPRDLYTKFLHQSEPARRGH